jgi:hypothetical protein
MHADMAGVVHSAAALVTPGRSRWLKQQDMVRLLRTLSCTLEGNGATLRGPGRRAVAKLHLLTATAVDQQTAGRQSPKGGRATRLPAPHSIFLCIEEASTSTTSRSAGHASDSPYLRMFYFRLCRS